MPERAPQAVLFDLDGTLADTEETHRQAFNAAFIEFALWWDWSPPLYASLLKVSGGKERLRHYIGTLRVPLRLIIAPAAGACQCGAAFSVATPRRMQSGFFLVRGKKKAGSFRCRPARQRSARRYRCRLRRGC